MQWIILIISSTYLTISIRKVYDTKKWPTAISKAIFTNFGYLMILSFLVFIIFVISIIHLGFQMT
jgi:choline-glycine betaine transporter